MKNMSQQNPNHNMKMDANKHKPENKDNLDSREGEEQLIKGTDITHNKKIKRNEKTNINRNKH